MSVRSGRQEGVFVMMNSRSLFVLVEDGIDGVLDGCAVGVVGCAYTFLLGGIASALLGMALVHIFSRNRYTEVEQCMVVAEGWTVEQVPTPSTISTISCSSGSLAAVMLCDSSRSTASALPSVSMLSASSIMSSSSSISSTNFFRDSTCPWRVADFEMVVRLDFLEVRGCGMTVVGKCGALVADCLFMIN